jgi:hypothetical protein
VSKKPKKQGVRVLGVLFEVNFSEKVLDDDGADVYGTTDGPGRLISVSTTLNKTEDARSATLVHEWCHAVLYVTGLSEGLTVEQEEAIVIANEHALEQAGFVLELEELV